MTALNLQALADLPHYGLAAQHIRAGCDPWWQLTGDGEIHYLVVVDYITEGGGGTGEYDVFADTEAEAEEIGRQLQNRYLGEVFYEIFAVKVIRWDGGEA